MASNKITKKWDAELRRKQKERAQREASGGRRRPAPVSEGASSRTGAPTLDDALEMAGTEG